ncbi:MAG: NAD(P)/FAD-dependent oxidoreductase [Acidobacteriota bacterium]|nr:NAD(P)/FAD-dependent oxidoreductase [Acidobacteriota bacterium]
MPENSRKKVVIIGGGPAGLTAAYQLCKAGVQSVVLEKSTGVGGISKTVNYKGYHFDIGGHRFFTKVKAVEEMWHEVLPNGDFLRRKRLSRIYYDGKLFHYPLRLFSTLARMGVWPTFLIGLSYLKAKMSPELPAVTFEQYISNHFGKRLYRTFFKSYTEKVWGVPCSEITAEWASQRIKGLSLKTALRNALVPPRTKAGVVKSLIDEFDYPKRGPGMMWETTADIVSRSGGQVYLGTDVERILWSDGKVDAVEVTSGGRREVITGTYFINSMPLREMIQKFDPAVPEDVLNAALDLKYRDFITVALVINKRDVFPDNWIYIHDPSVRLGRVQNFKSWSPGMVPDPAKTCLGLEYFCFEGDGLWTMSDEDLKELGKRELVKIGLIEAADVEDGSVVRMPKAYPVYDSTYVTSLHRVRQFLEELHNFQTVGRNGMHKYNNQDHSMLTAMLAVKNILGADYDLWKVNADQEYHEEIAESEDVAADHRHLASSQPRVPERITKASP